MKKRILIPVFVLCAMFALSGCNFGSGNSSNSNSSDNSQSAMPEVYTVTFQQAGQPDVVKTVAEGEDLTDIPTVKEKTGYTVAWENVDLTNISDNLVVKAKETPNEYTIKYVVNGGDELEDSTQTVTYDQPYTLIEPTREGWGFQGWQYGEELYAAGEYAEWKTADNVTYTAKWVDERPSVVVSFEQFNQTATRVTLKKGETIDEAKIPTPADRVGYTVDKENWYTDTACTTVADLSVAVTTSFSVYAKETPNTYTLSYDLNYTDAPTVADEAVVYDSEYTLMTDPQREDFTFLGWKAYDENNQEIQLSKNWNIAGDVTLKAQWEEIIPETFTLTFIYENNAYSSVTLEVGETLAQADIPTLPASNKGYTVSVWCTDSACTIAADFATITSATTLYAKQIANEYEVTYVVENGTIEGGVYSDTFTYGKSYSLKTPTHNVSGFEFDGWLNGNETMAMQGIWNLDSDVTLTAKWNDNRVSYMVTFMRGSEKLGEVSVKAGDSVPADKIPEITNKTGYTVDTQNWYAEMDCTTVVDLNGAVTKSFSVYVKETANTYTVRYSLEGGQLPDGVQETFTVTYGETVTLAKPTQTGKIFNGWKRLDGTALVEVKDGSVWNIASDTTLIAQWLDDEEWAENQGWTGNY